MNRIAERVRMEALRSVLLRSAITVGLLSLVLAGGPGLQLGLLGLSLCAGAWALSEHPPRRGFWRLASVLVSVSCVAVPMVTSVPWSVAGMALLVYLQVHRARTAQGLSDDRLSLLFAMLMVLLASTTSRSPWMGLVMLGLVLGLPTTLLVLSLAELERQRAVRRESLGTRGRALALLALGPGVLLVTAGFFLMIPRLNAEALSEFGERQDLAGFDEGVELGELGEIKDNQELVLRMRVTDDRGEVQRGPYYVRGVALDHFDGSRWTAGVGEVARIAPADPGLAPQVAPEGLLLQEIQLEPIQAAPIFALARVEALYSTQRAWRDRRGLRWAEEPRRREYSVLSDPNRGLAVPKRAQRSPEFLALPDDLDPRVGELAERVAGQVDAPFAKAAALQGYLHDNYDYTLLPTASTSGQALSVFLFDSRRGHCEYFATALAVLLRAEGVPARLVNGFYGGDFNPLTGQILVRQSHAHSWVEAHMPGQGWVRFDATPSGALPEDSGGLLSQLLDALESRWYSSVLDYDLHRQVSGVTQLGQAVASLGGEERVTPAAPEAQLPEGLLGVLVLVVAGAALAAVLGLLVRRWMFGKRPPRLRGVALVHGKARRLVRRRGWTIPPSLPPVEAAGWLVEQAGEAARPLEELAWLHYRVRYASEPEGPALARARAALEALRELPGP